MQLLLRSADSDRHSTYLERFDRFLYEEQCSGIYAVNSRPSEFPPQQQLPAGKVLAFSGGGSRATAVFGGAVRALHEHSLSQHADGISSVSGATWGCTMPRHSQVGHTRMYAAETKSTTGIPGEVSVWRVGS